MSAIATYLNEIQKDYEGGRATEHTYRTALKKLIESLGENITAINEPKHIECGSVDYIVSKDTQHGPLILGYIETKKIDKSLDEVERSEQLKRYLALPNLILTDYLEFRWYVEGKRQKIARLGKLDENGKLSFEKRDVEDCRGLLEAFIANAPEPVSDPRELAARMAKLTHFVRDIIIESFRLRKESETLKELRTAFAVNLIPDLNEPEKAPDFADMYAQTIAYGLFAAWVNHKDPSPFKRIGAAYDIPKTNPFLRRLFENITGTALNDEPYVGFVDAVASLMAHADKNAVLEHFGKRGRGEDPVVHFYETFLAAYDPKLREARGVYYTPEPVVSYIVESLDLILKEAFGCQNGLAENDSHRVLILDPACGTGTFLYGVVDYIRNQFRERNDAGSWPGYVRKNLLPRLFGFELLMAPYAVAHFKLAMQLAAFDMDEPVRKDWAYNFESSERLGIYLTNTLEEAEGRTRQLGLFAKFIADEADATAKIKNELPILVVMGNPPYSGHSANRSWEEKDGKREKTFIGRMVDDYYFVDGEPLGERNPKWLQDDYVKFIRWGQWRIERTESGILGLITNHSYLDNPTFRGMRRQLMKVFDEIYIVDLHGNAKKKERCPDGSKDENVFDIQQGVAIAIFVKKPRKRKSAVASVHHADCWGLRKEKFRTLEKSNIKKTKWKILEPKNPYYFFIPQTEKRLREYKRGWKITELMPSNVLGFQTHHDEFAIDFDKEKLKERILEMRNEKLNDHEFARKYELGDTRDWKLSSARRAIRGMNDWEKNLINCLYRPFDKRYCYFSEIGMERPRTLLSKHVANKFNLCLNVVRQTKLMSWRHAVASNVPTPAIYVEIKDGSNVFPLYLYPDPEKNGHLFSNGTKRHVNLNQEFIAQFEKSLGLKFIYDGKGNLKKTFGPEDVFNYIYAVFHSPTYRERYKEFLKTDFPRVPLTSDINLFKVLVKLGAELVSLHLMEAPILSNRARLITRFPARGDNYVEKGFPKYDKKNERVYISEDDVKLSKKGQYFEKVPPDVWDYHVGSYQVCHKWLKDRQGRNLSDDEIATYPRIVMALGETLRIMGEIDDAIEKWPIT